MKVRVITELKKWVSGSGYQSTEVYQDETVEVTSCNSCDFSFWEPEELPEGEDLEICVKYYRADDEEALVPLAEFSKWNNEF